MTVVNNAILVKN